MALILQGLLDHLPLSDLPPAWADFDLQAFSASKGLWDYQQEALQNAIKSLWVYYEDHGDYQPNESEDRITLRKEAFYQWYSDNGLKKGDLDLKLGRQKRQISDLLATYYPARKARIPYHYFINRINFWMATGSGKTVVIVKLLEILWGLMQRDEIPRHPVLILSHRDELLEQIREHIAEFNAGRGDMHIRLHELKALPEVQRSAPSLFRSQEMNVYIYRSDNLSDEQKDKIIDFRNYENGGKWYILLDEAHKGDREDSKRQHIYSILSRNGFLFNFSATFTDPRDILTTAFDFNLARFIQAGYGKHLAILQQENRAFRDDEDFTDAEKQKIVIKALFMLAYAQKAGRKLAGIDPLQYHRPLLVTLVNSVNTQDADLKLFFRQIERIGAKDVDAAVWQAAKNELWDELSQGVPLLFEGDTAFGVARAAYEALTLDDILASVYNASGPGQIEVLVRPSNRQEIAFKLKSADRPFALIRIGDIAGWMNDELEGYEVVEGFSDESYFEQINADDSDINLLMGSRTFYEGWDSNRPNIITYINIGTGTDAKKFITQSIGRGVRVEPMRGERKRLQPLFNARKVEAALYRQVCDDVAPLETLLILGTNRNAIQTVIEQMDTEAQKEQAGEISMQVNQDAIGSHPLLIPEYRSSNKMLIDQRETARFVITPDDLKLLTDYWHYLGDERLLFAQHGLTPRQISLIRRTLEDPAKYFNTGAPDARPIGNVELLLPRVARYFSLIPEEFKTLKLLEDEIRHFRHIRVYLDDLRRKELSDKVERVANWKAVSEDALKARLASGEIDINEYTEQIKDATRQVREERFAEAGVTLHIRHIASHYYVPLILSDKERVAYIRSIIHYESEVRFISALESYYQQPGNKLAGYDWWLFSRIDEAQDDIYIPYYHQDHRVAQFKPDFIFWLREGDEYTILFVDPKGVSRTDYERKVDGFRELFEENGKPRTFKHNDTNVHFDLKLFTIHDASSLPQGYRQFWLDHDRLGEMF